MRSSVFIILSIIPQFLWSQQIIEKEITDWEFRIVGDSVWKKAKVPGTIIDNFVDLSDISNPLHPYYGDNEKLYQWVAEKDWEFRSKIEVRVPHSDYFQGHAEIEFECLDLFADIYINGRKWHHENAFYPKQCTITHLDVEDLLMTVKAEIRVVIHSTSQQLQKLTALDSLKYPGGERVYARKPQYEFGWDWGPKFLNMGIRKAVKFRIYAPGSLSMKTELKELQLSENLANLKFDLTCNTQRNEAFKINTVVKLGSEIVHQSNEIKQLDIYKKINLTIGINDPQLWWPNGMGQATYYTFEIWITDAYNNILDKEIFQVPLCNIQLIQEKDKNGETFYFKVNDKKVFAKGANYVPDDSFHPGMNTHVLVDLAANANMNMIRIWGGGNYPDDEFYDQCMKKGIMVWQDFMFACAMYPADDTSLYNYAYEADYISQRLNKFKNIAVWCGNNENEEGWNNWGWQKELKISQKDSSDIAYGNNALFHSFLPGILNGDYHNQTQHADYLPTSPKHGWGRKESMTDGDSHYWGVWWGLEPIEKYNEKVPQFMSEFGMQAMPDLATLKKVIPDSSMNFHSRLFKNHQKHPTGFQTLDHYLKEYLVVPDNMEDYAYATQILQAYALTTAIEAQRRAMPYCMGSLIWQLNDCWPVTSWSLVDYELKKKIAYYEVKEAFEPISVSVKEEKGHYVVFVISDSNKTVKANLIIQITDFYGKKKLVKKMRINIPSGSSKEYFRISRAKIQHYDPTSIYMNLILYNENKKEFPHYTSYANENYHFVKLNQLKLPKTDIKIEKDNNDIYSITSDTYCPYVMVTCENPDSTIYLGTIGKHRSMGFVTYHADQRKWLEDAIKDPSKIKCLNNLLNH